MPLGVWRDIIGNSDVVRVLWIHLGLKSNVEQKFYHTESVVIYFVTQ